MPFTVATCKPLSRIKETTAIPKSLGKLLHCSVPLIHAPLPVDQMLTHITLQKLLQNQSLFIKEEFSEK